MKRKWWLVPVALTALIGVIWMFASGTVDTTPLQTLLGIKPAATPVAKQKPICSQVVVPAGDCIPQYLAHLPPDPGEAGKRTIEGIDSDGDGVRDDVQRFIAEHWGQSERAVKVLTKIAKAKQGAVQMGDSVTREEARVLVQPMLDAGACYALALDQSIWDTSALERVGKAVANTPERAERNHAFNYKAAHSVYPVNPGTTADVCGFDPAQFAN